MPIEREIDEARQLTVLTVVGAVTFIEMRRTIESFWEAPALTLNVLWDYRQADLSGLSRADHEALVRVGLEYRDRHAERIGGKTAIIAASVLEYGLNRASEVLTYLEGYPFEVKTFRTVDEAEAWLAQTD
jgi:hypothetical protein